MKWDFFFLNPTHIYLLVVALNGMLNQCVTLIIEYCVTKAH